MNELNYKWHHDVRITKDTRTADLSTPYNGRSMVCKQKLISAVQELYGDSFCEKTVLDVACNAGAHLFECQMFGIKSGFGFDVRQYWIDQANWLKGKIDLMDTSNLHFQVADMKILSEFIPSSYDIVFFNGILYHLENPLSHLKAVAEITKDLLVIDTAYQSGCNYHGFVFSEESKQEKHHLSGIGETDFGINWLPTGPDVLRLILSQYGFNEFQVQHISEVGEGKGRGRFCLFSRKK